MDASQSLDYFLHSPLSLFALTILFYVLLRAAWGFFHKEESGSEDSAQQNQ